MYNFRPSTISKLRKGTVDDPYIIIDETHQVGNGKVVLSEIPEASYRVTVSGGNITWSEIRSGLPNENEYIVNYETAEVKFHNDKNGSQLEFHYKGRGLQYIDAKRVYTKVSNGDVVETLDDLINTTDERISTISNKINETDQLITETNQVKDDTEQTRQEILIDYEDVVTQTKVVILPFVETYAQIATTYPSPQLGWTVQVKADGIEYRYNGQQWQPYRMTGLVSNGEIVSGNIPPQNVNVIWLDTSTPITKLKRYSNSTLTWDEIKTNTKFDTLHNSITISTNTNTVNIGISAFNTLEDALFVTANSISLIKDVDYTIHASGVSIVKTSGQWNSGTIFDFTVLKTERANHNFSDGSLISDGSITENKVVEGLKISPALVDKNGVAHANLKDRLLSVDEQMADLATFEEENESAPLGVELVTNLGWTSTGWTGSYETGFTHETGNTNPLTYPLNAIANRLYQVDLTVEDTDLMNSGFKFNVTIGNSQPFEMYQGVGSPIFYSRGIKASANGDLKIIPNSDFTGTVKNISVKEVTGVIPPTTIIRDVDGNSVFEARPTKENLNNIFMGKNSGEKNTSGLENTIIGHNAMPNNLSGFWNSALGFNALLNNINGSRNIAVGRRSLEANISGHRNIAVGTFALHRVTTGAYNIGIGADSAWYTTSGNYNIAIGTVSLDKNTTGSGNIAIGYNALRDNETTSYNVAIGHWALRENKAHNNTAVGSRAAEKNTTASGNTAIGYESLRNNTTGTNNTVVGQWAGQNVIGSNNTLIGRMAGSNLTSGSRNILIGSGVNAPNETQSDFMNIGNFLYGTLGTKRLGIDVENPTAALHVKAGTAGTPPVRLEAGTLTSQLQVGALEFDGTDLYFTVSGLRKKIAFQ